MGDRVVECSGKFAHASKANAQRAIRQGKHARLQVYRCPHCRAWHIGSSLVPRHARWSNPFA
jgi:ribosomal protein L37AE/L43A